MWQTAQKIAMELILWAMISIIVVEGFDSPNRPQIEAEARRMKAEAPETMSIKYNDESGQLVHIILKKVLNTIPSALLPIWDITDDEEISAEHVLDHFVAVCYHGVNTYSAITYFPHSETLYGVIDYRFYIEALPRTLSNNPSVVNFHMYPMQGNVHAPEFPTAQHRQKRQTGPPGIGNDLNCLLRKKFKRTLYPEILLVIDSVVRINYNNPVAPHEKVVMYAIAYWNAVDMLFSHLAGTEMKINIAGIIVGETSDIAQHIAEESYTVDDDSQIYIMNHVALDKLGSYFHGDRIEIQRDSYDFLIWMTQSSLLTPQGRNPGGPELGISTPPADCGGTHEEEEISKKISNRAVIMHDAEYSNYHTAARVLASMMFVSIDNLQRPDSGVEGPSRGIMDPLNLRTEGCLRWSYQSVADFAKYAISKSSCCLLNFPHRTMEKPFTPLPELTADKQCQCYKMEADEQLDHDEGMCNAPLYCKDQRGQLKNVGLPLDGTLCQRLDDVGFCRLNACV